MNSMWLGAGLSAVLFAACATAQAPASAPTGSTGMCKDGTYSTAAHKSGACSGHKGVQAWYVADNAPSKPSAASSPTPSAATAPAPAAASRPVPTPTPTAAPAPKTTQSAQQTPAPGGGPGMVWVNTASKVYHCPGTAYYGKTKAGKYVSEDAAKAEGDRADHGKLCSK